MLSCASIAVKMWFQERENDDCQGGAEDSRCIPLAKTAQSDGKQLSYWTVLALFLGKLIKPPLQSQLFVRFFASRFNKRESGPARNGASANKTFGT